jgi:hypothetical protein
MTARQATMLIYTSRETLIVAGLVLMAGGIGMWRFGKNRRTQLSRTPNSFFVVVALAGIVAAAAGALIIWAAVFAWALP